jgi:hypothetical protein
LKKTSTRVTLHSVQQCVHLFQRALALFRECCLLLGDSRAFFRKSCISFLDFRVIPVVGVELLTDAVFAGFVLNTLVPDPMDR